MRLDDYAGEGIVKLMSESRRESVKWNVPRKRGWSLPHGMAGDHCMSGQRREGGGTRLWLLLPGYTERDFGLAAAVDKRLPPEQYGWRGRTVTLERRLYDGIFCVTMLPRLSDEQVREECCQADLLGMPRLDSAANNVFLESMACGTPVMITRVGGVPEYVPGDFNAVMPAGADADAWVGKLTQFAENRERLDTWRPVARHWAERLDWKIVAEAYRALYRAMT